MPDITFTEDAFSEYMDWQTDKQVIKRINLLIRDILRSPYTGIGKPEPLRHDLSGFWSRRITDSDRLVYRICEDRIEIVQCKGHYES